MTADASPTLAALRVLDTFCAANVPEPTPYWIAYPHCDIWRVSLSNWDGGPGEEVYGPGDAGEEAALRVAIARNKALCPAEPVAEEGEP